MSSTSATATTDPHLVPSEERDRMLAGQLYHGFHPAIAAERVRTRALLREYNDELDPNDRTGQIRVMRALFGPGVAHLADDEMPWIEAPFKCDYGSYISFGKDVFINFNAVILDVCPVRFGDKVLLGPNVSVYAAEHPLSPAVRNGTKGPEFGRPITIGSNVWLGGNVVVTSGVTIGDGTTVGAGSVVTKDVPGMSVAVGNPARVVRTLEEREVTPAELADPDTDPRWVGLVRPAPKQ
ncbi:hypothetical protein H9P43_004358 [Blastocladiella emersonii ATCC 22665]|nr:hypothetical protein H9P43_004358 [Blastocladiella emersonii ATCC 22665]